MICSNTYYLLVFGENCPREIRDSAVLRKYEFLPEKECWQRYYLSPFFFALSVVAALRSDYHIHILLTFIV